MSKQFCPRASSRKYKQKYLQATIHFINYIFFLSGGTVSTIGLKYLFNISLMKGFRLFAKVLEMTEEHTI